ncbi:hypothetical protein D3C72_1236140 [compost metagenome]
MGVEADDRIEVVLEQAGADHVADPCSFWAAVFDHLAGVDVADLQILGVFLNIEAVAVRAFGGDQAGVAHAVPVETLRPAPGLAQSRLVLAPHVARDHPHRDVAPRLQPHLAGHRRQLLDVVGEAHDHRSAEVLHQLDLLHRAGLDPRSGRQEDRAGPVGHGLAHIVAAVDHAVAIDRMDHVIGAQALETIEAGQQDVLHLAALGTKQQDLGLAGRARGRVQDHRRAVLIVLEAGEIPERRSQIQAGHDVRLVEDRQLGQVVQRADVARLDALRAPQSAIEGRLPRPVHTPHEQAVLMRVQFVAADARDEAGEVVADGVVARQGGRVHVLPIGAVGVGHASLPAASLKARAASYKVSKSSSMAASGS